MELDALATIQSVTKTDKISLFNIKILPFLFFIVEIRNHGVGYYQFSTNEEERQEQMKTLDKLRDQVWKQTILNEEKKLVLD